MILFDGVCNLCNAAVNFIIDRDRTGRFRFASLQSPAAARLLGGTPVHGDPETVVLVEGDRRYERSTAALRIARRLGGPWRLLYAFILVPQPVRDTVYRWIARNRYRWFGRTDACRLPTPELAGRFME